MKKNRRKVDIVVLSDIHLGTYGCQAKELLKYLKSIKPKKLIFGKHAKKPIKSAEK